MKTPIVAAAAIVACLISSPTESAEPLRGHHVDVGVSTETRLDWVFALANQSPPTVPEGWLDDYDSTQQSYELFVPPAYNEKRAWPVVLFVSPGARGTGFANWRDVCRKHGVIFASPHNAGNDCPMRRRVRIVMDVLDDLRRKYNTDVDRTYVGGFSGGGRIAIAIAFALPEHFGGAIPVCAAGDLRPEPWLRQRVIERLSVAHVTGQRDFNRGEVERFRGPLLADVGVRSRVWVVDRMGHAIPNAARLEQVYRWLEQAARDRQQFGQRFPASRIPGDAAPSRTDRADALLAEAKDRLEKPETLYSGLMQLMGVRSRWPDLPAARSARDILAAYEAKADRPWEEEDVRQQRKFLIARARALDAYATGDLPKQYAERRAEMAEAALNLWKLVIADGKDAQAADQGKRRIPVLQALVGDKQDQKDR